MTDLVKEGLRGNRLSEATISLFHEIQRVQVLKYNVMPTKITVYRGMAVAIKDKHLDNIFP